MFHQLVVFAAGRMAELKDAEKGSRKIKRRDNDGLPYGKMYNKGRKNGKIAWR